ncbi:MAG: NAD(+) synthase [Bacteroidales bacterium]
MIKDYKTAVKNIRTILADYIREHKLKSLVVGLSGGIDSSLCAVLAYPVCNELGISLIGRSITIETNKPEEIKRAAAIGKHFTTDFLEVDLTAIFKQMADVLIEKDENEDKNSFEFKIRRGNMKARTRMIYLYDLAAKNRGMVLSTDNFTELMLGFWTLHGDVGDYGMVQNLWKTEIYGMASFLAEEMEKEPRQALKDCITAIATDGLGITNSDLDQLGAATYDEVDQVLLKLFLPEIPPQFKNHPVIKRKFSSEYKRNNPYNIPRNQITDAPYA